MAEARKDLRSAVRGMWDTSENLKHIQDELTKRGFELVHAGFKECLEKGTESVQKCYAKYGKTLSENYRGIWGAK